MSSFIIKGGYPLKGTITPQGAKNEALQIICACLLTDEKVTVHNVPDIKDVNNLISLIRKIGVKVVKCSEKTYEFQADNIDLEYLQSYGFTQECANLRGAS